MLSNEDGPQEKDRQVLVHLGDLPHLRRRSLGAGKPGGYVELHRSMSEVLFEDC